ncbi:MAG: 30S ribosomal protein S21 [Candidatus Omnitrophica bacterium]|nr:30S ribosomal protein S21 [Candidatus Omnitrophota bacterium]MBU1924398.1 30S ribosomal protein S21 [Candidatus Omnitrophota bacterium]
MAKISVYGKDGLEKALRSFRLRCKKEGIFDSCRDKKHYTKPSVKRRQSAMKKKFKSTKQT